ncbi:MAG TPA: MFS transporter [Solirubrobacteraceae bacterium]
MLWFGGGALFLCYLGQTVLGVIQPAIHAELRLDASQAQWVVNSFFLALALFAAPGGRLGDYYGHRRVLMVALTMVALGSVSAALADGFVWLVASLAFVGAGAASLYPSSAALVANGVAPEVRGRAIGQYSAIGVSVFAIGPLAAGVLTEAASWRALFVLQAVLAAGLVAFGARFVRERPAGSPRPFDTRGLVMLLAGLTAVLVALMQALSWGWDSPATLLLLGVGLIVLAAFGVCEARTRDPLLDTRLLRGSGFRSIVLAMFAAQFMLSSFTIYIATYLQHVLGFGALLASVAMLPAFGLSPLNALVSGRLTDRLGARVLAIGGYALAAIGLVWVAVSIPANNYWLLVPGLLALAVGAGPMFTSLLTALSGAVGPAERGDANALVLTVRWIGAAAGTVVLGLVVHAGEHVGVPDSSGYLRAFLIDAVVTGLGLLACLRLQSGLAEDRSDPH